MSEALDPARSPSTLLLHDGELDDVAALLATFGVTPVSVRTTDRSPATAHWDLVVTTARRALADSASLAPGEGEDAPVRVVIATEDSPTLRKQLRATGFDYLVRRPVDPGALRLLFLRLLYQGPERRRTERFASGREVSYRLGNRERFAVLGDLSESGCRLLHAASAEPGERVLVDVPADEGGHATVSARGRVLRVAAPARGEGGYTLAVVFDRVDPDSRARLREALRTSVIGSEAAPRKSAPASERRRAHRGAFPRRVIALRAEADRVLMGRDLSAGGMRVESHPTLRVGERLRLALYADAASQPWIVGATVIRNDMDGGMGLRFDVLSPEVARRMEAFVAALPPVEPLQGGEAGSLGAVITQILD